MIRLLITFCFIIQIQAQNLDSDKAVKAVIDTFFEGFHKGDTLLMKSVMKGNFTTQTIFKNREGKAILQTGNASDLVNAIANRPVDQKWDERLLSYDIKIDDNMANVWTPYEFWFNGKFRHCGVNSFQLFNDSDKWKIIYLIDTRRREECQ